MNYLELWKICIISLYQFSTETETKINSFVSYLDQIFWPATVTEGMRTRACLNLLKNTASRTTSLSRGPSRTWTSHWTMPCLFSGSRLKDPTIENRFRFEYCHLRHLSTILQPDIITCLYIKLSSWWYWTVVRISKTCDKYFVLRIGYAIYNFTSVQHCTVLNKLSETLNEVKKYMAFSQ